MPQLLIAPFKEEDEWDSPHIVRYYDVMSDEEIERIKEIAKPKVGVSVGPAGPLSEAGYSPSCCLCGAACLCANSLSPIATVSALTCCGLRLTL